MASPIRNFPCNTCSMTYTTSASQRAHMRSPWHVANLHRKIEGESALSEEEYTAANPTISVQERNSQNRPIEVRIQIPHHSKVETEIEKEHITPVEQCLFCLHISTSLEKSIEHMSHAHSFVLPKTHLLNDVDTFLGYLTTLVYTHHECLWCGVGKGSVESVQTHMRDKRHCKVRLEDFRDFWEEEGEVEMDERRGVAVSDGGTEWRLPSGAIIHSRLDKPSPTRSRNKELRRKTEGQAAITSSDDTHTPPVGERQVQLSTSRNANFSLVGLGEAQIRSLERTEKKMKSREEKVKAAGRYAMEQAPVLTKYYKTENPVYQAG